jgi:hypothetical protein
MAIKPARVAEIRAQSNAGLLQHIAGLRAALRRAAP